MSKELSWRTITRLILASSKDTIIILQQVGIKALMHGESGDFEAFRLVALSDLSNQGEQRTHLILDSDLEGLRKHRLAQPVLAFVRGRTSVK